MTAWTGELVFSINAWADGLRKTWGDGKTRRVERMVLEIVGGIELILETIRVRREEREGQWKILQHRRQLAQARLKREETRLSHLRQIIELRREAREIREWISGLPQEASLAVDSDPGRMLQVGRSHGWPKRSTSNRTGCLRNPLRAKAICCRQSTSSKIRLSNPPSALAGATECFSSAQAFLWPLFA